MKRIASILLLLAVVITTGCSKTQQTSGSNSAESTTSNSTMENSSAETKVTEETEATEEAKEYSLVNNVNILDSVSDNAIPKNWLAICTTSEVLEHFDEIIGYEHSDDISDVIVSLVNKNVLFFATIKGELFEIQWDNPIVIENTRVYPVESSIFTNVEAIYEFADSIYDVSIVENYLTNAKKDNGKLFYSGENGQLCANTENFSNWSSDPFFSRTYIEITEVTDEHCTFVWHYPDIEGLNEPPEGLQYFYYEKQYTAKCNDGVWTLDTVIFDNWD